MVEELIRFFFFISFSFTSINTVNKGNINKKIDAPEIGNLIIVLLLDNIYIVCFIISIGGAALNFYLIIFFLNYFN